MANNRIQVKRTSTAGRTANVTSSGNTQYINAGELALNMADGILYSSNGSALIEIGANNTTARVTGTLTVNAISANGGVGTSGQFLTSNGTATYWSTVTGGTGTVTSVATGNGMTGGPFTTSGTVSVLANTGIIANTTGVYVNATYIGTLSANNTTYVNGKTEGNLNVNNATTAYGKAEIAINANSALTANNADYLDGQHGSFYTNATNITTGTLPYARLGGNVVNTTSSFTFTNFQTIDVADNQLLLHAGGTSHPTLIQRNDSSNYYLLLSANGTSASGTWNTLRPFYINLQTGLLTSQNGQSFSGVSTFNSNVVLGATTITANGGVGTAGQVLTSGASGNVYWSTASSGTPSSITRQNFSGDGTTTSFTVAGGYTSGQVDVYLNGVKLLNGTDVTVTSGTAVVFAVAPPSGSNIEVTAITVSNVITANEVGGYYKGGSSAAGNASNANNVFRINSQTLFNDTFINADENASCAGPVAVAVGKTLTVAPGGRIVIA